MYIFCDDTLDSEAKIGKKAAGLFEIKKNNFSTPHFFCITPDAILNLKLDEHFKSNVDKSLRYIRSKNRAEIFSVRSSPQSSMPGLLTTFIYIGLGDNTLKKLIEFLKDELTAYKIYAKHIIGYSKDIKGVSLGVVPSENGDLNYYKSLVSALKSAYLCQFNDEFPSCVYTQIYEAVLACFNSFKSRRAKGYMFKNSIEHTALPSVIVQKMVFGNAGADSGTGVIFSHNLKNGEFLPYGEYIENSHGTCLMDGSSTPDSLEALKCVHRSCFDKLNEACAAFSKIYDGVVEIEFTIEKGALFFLQVRPVKVSNVLALKLFCKGHKSSFDPDYFSSALSGAKIFIPENQRPVLEGKVVSDGVGIGKPAFSYIDAINFSKKGEDFIFLNPKSSVNFPYDLPHLKGVVFLGGGMTSHGCAIAREFNIPCFVAGGVNKIRFSHNSILLNDIKISKHRPVSLDANNGCLYEDAVRLHNIEEYDFVREFAEAYRERISKDPSKRNEKYDMLLERFEKKG